MFRIFTLFKNYLIADNDLKQHAYKIFNRKKSTQRLFLFSIPPMFLLSFIALVASSSSPLYFILFVIFFYDMSTYIRHRFYIKNELRKEGSFSEGMGYNLLSFIFCLFLFPNSFITLITQTPSEDISLFLYYPFEILISFLFLIGFFIPYMLCYNFYEFVYRLEQKKNPEKQLGKMVTNEC